MRDRVAVAVAVSVVALATACGSSHPAAAPVSAPTVASSSLAEPSSVAPATEASTAPASEPGHGLIFADCTGFGSASGLTVTLTSLAPEAGATPQSFATFTLPSGATMTGDLGTNGCAFARDDFTKNFDGLAATAYDTATNTKAVVLAHTDGTTTTLTPASSGGFSSAMSYFGARISQINGNILFEGNSSGDVRDNPSVFYISPSDLSAAPSQLSGSPDRVFLDAAFDEHVAPKDDYVLSDGPDLQSLTQPNAESMPLQIPLTFGCTPGPILDEHRFLCSDNSHEGVATVTTPAGLWLITLNAKLAATSTLPLLPPAQGRSIGQVVASPDGGGAAFVSTQGQQTTVFTVDTTGRKQLTTVGTPPSGVLIGWR